MSKGTRPTRRFAGVVAAFVAVGLLASACSASSGEEVVTITQTTGLAGGSPVTVSGLTSGAQSSAAATTTASSTSSAAAATTTSQGIRYTAKPAFGSKNLPPNDPFTMTIFSGKITQVVMAGDDGTTIKGTIGNSATTWTTAERLGYDITYTIEATVAPLAGGKSTTISGKISTIKPKKTVGIQINIPDGATVGVAAPIIVTFLGTLSDTGKAAAEAALSVTTSAGAKLQGNWGWVQDEDFQGAGYKQSQVHWRPTASPAQTSATSPPYYPAGTKVTVSANLAGVDYGDGDWGRSDVTSSFNVRKDGIVMKADSNSHHLVVTSSTDGSIIKDFPVSYGLNDVQQRNTVSGVHIVQEKWPTKVMCNTAFGYCGVSEKWAVRINNNGEFIHENDKVINQLGKENVSHGCINMGPVDAKTFYDMAIFGDPVEVTNTNAQMSEKDAVYDWIFSAADWKAMSKLG